jgi:hypothetical protein
MVLRKNRIQGLRRIFTIYSSNISKRFAKKFVNGNSSYQDVGFVIANGDDDYGRILVELISSKIFVDEIFYEGQPFIVCGQVSRQKLYSPLKSLDPKVAYELKKFIGIPVVVADNDSIALFAFE